jgi:hypothetical protein
MVAAQIGGATIKRYACSVEFYSGRLKTAPTLAPLGPIAPLSTLALVFVGLQAVFLRERGYLATPAQRRLQPGLDGIA